MTGGELGPLDHISRRPLPWRTEPDLTECGKPIRELAGHVITQDEVKRRIRDVGQKRAAFSTCMTCADTCGRWARGRQDNAMTAITREVAAVQHTHGLATVDVRYDSRWERSRVARENQLWDRRRRLEAELEAIAALIAAHPEEFHGYVAGVGDTVNLADRRRTRKATQ